MKTQNKRKTTELGPWGIYQKQESYVENKIEPERLQSIQKSPYRITVKLPRINHHENKPTQSIMQNHNKSMPLTVLKPYQHNLHLSDDEKISKWNSNFNESGYMRYSSMNGSVVNFNKKNTFICNNSRSFQLIQMSSRRYLEYDHQIEINRHRDKKQKGRLSSQLSKVDIGVAENTTVHTNQAYLENLLKNKTKSIQTSQELMGIKIFQNKNSNAKKSLNQQHQKQSLNYEHSKKRSLSYIINQIKHHKQYFEKHLPSNLT